MERNPLAREIKRQNGSIDGSNFSRRKKINREGIPHHNIKKPLILKRSR